MNVDDTAKRDVAILTAFTVLPYFCSKAAIAANTAYVEYYYGLVGGTTLAAEADTLHWEFLWMGTAMGGLRAVSVLSAKIVTEMQRFRTPTWPRADAETGGWTWRRCLALFCRGALPPSSSVTLDNPESASSAHQETLQLTDQDIDHQELFRLQMQLGALNNAATLWTSLYSIVAMLAFYHGASWFFIAKDTPSAVLERVQDYGRGFWWGVLPTLWLYLNEQFALGLHASGIAMVYGGLVYAVSATVIGACLYSDHGAFGLGIGMSAGAWIGWIGLKLHFTLDPRFRHLSLNFEPLFVRSRRQEYIAMLSASSAEYLKLAAPLAVSNMSSLARGLIVAAWVTAASTNDAFAYSISGAYFQTLNIAMLGASSCVSAIMSAKDPYHNRTDVTAATSRRYLITTGLLVCGLAAFLGALPLIFPEQFAVLFGGKVYAFGSDTVHSIMPQIKKFNWISFAEYCIAVVGMVVSAALHGFKDVYVPMLITIIASATGVVWSVACTKHDPMQVTLIASGGVVTQTVALSLMSAWFIYRRRAILSPPGPG